MTKKKIKHGAIPTLNMPQKSHSKCTIISTAKQNRLTLITLPPKFSYYKSIKDLQGRIKNLKSLHQWEQHYSDNGVVLKKYTENVSISALQITIDDGLGFTIKIYGWQLPENHHIYKLNRRSLTNTTVSYLVSECESYVVCGGVKPILDSKVLIHSVPKTTNDDAEDNIPKPFNSLT